MNRIQRLLTALVAACCLFTGAAAAEAGMISLEDEIKMGRETAQQLEAQYGLYQNSYAQERVERIGQSLAAVCGREELTYSFKVLNNDEVNALACPGGFVYVYKGLLDYMPTDMELAGVLGHEVGHVAKKHTVHSIEKQLWTSIALIAITRGQGLGLVQAAQQALFAGYSRTDERGADKEGVRNSIEAGYNPYGMLITVWKLDDLSKQGGGSSYGLFSSHPEPEERVKRVMKQLKSYNIHPDVVVEDDDHASVQEGDWRFNLSQSIGNTKAKYRAYELAGALWQVRQRGTIYPNYFVVRDYGGTADIYYDDIQVLRLYTQDAGAFGSAGAYAAACADLLRDWAAVATANAAQPAKKSKK